MNFLIVTNSYNRDKKLVEKSLLTSLSQLSSEDHLLFVDQNANALELSSKIANHPNITTQRYEVKGVSEARNILLSNDISSKYEWIIFCDDDGFWSENYMSTLKSIISKNPELEIIAGSILNSDGSGFYSPRHAIGGTLRKFIYHKLLMGSNFVVKRSCFLRLEGFDERFGTGSWWGSGEESDFCIKAYFEKVPMEYFRELSIYHIPPRSGDLFSEMRKAWKYAMGKGALIGKWLIKKRKPIVAIELMEMLIVPWIQFSIHVFKLDKKAMIFPVIFFGRLYGLVAGVLTE